MLRIFLLAALEMTYFAQAPQQSIVENFTVDPTVRRWEAFGAPGLIRWNSDTGDLNVTWDSSRANSYFRLALGTIMTRRDDFDASLDLLLHDFAAGVNPSKPGTFQLAFGFQNYSDASQSSFFRAGENAAPNLVEFNFMPDTGFGPTVWPAMMSTNGGMNYSGAGDFSNFDLPVGEVMRVSLAYRATNETLTITITTNGILVGSVTRARLATNDVAFGKKFTEFHVDTFAVASYSEAGQGGAYAGSILALGVIDNIEINIPPPPIRDFVGAFSGKIWEASFLSRVNWLYRLQRTEDFQLWQDVGDARVGDGNRIQLNEADVTPRAAFYRISAQPSN